MSFPRTKKHVICSTLREKKLSLSVWHGLNVDSLDERGLECAILYFYNSTCASQNRAVKLLDVRHLHIQNQFILKSDIHAFIHNVLFKSLLLRTVL